MMAQETKHSDITCTGCACLCDDLTVTVADGAIRRIEPACSLADERLLGLGPGVGPACTIDGREAPLAEAIEAAAGTLQSWKGPLVFGLSESATEGQRAAVALADRIGAVIDTTASLGHGSSILALQQEGESTASLGEIRHRADLVIYWGANPPMSHPRHRERYAVEAKGDETPRGREDRYLVLVGVDDQPNMRDVDLYVKLPAGRDLEAIHVLRGLVRGIEPSAEMSTLASLPLELLRTLALRMTACRTGVVFFGYGLAQQQLGHRSVEQLLRLVTDLNEQNRFYARRLRMVGDVSGADNVLCWQTGYPFSVSLSRGYPRYSPGEFSAQGVLERHEVDGAILIGTGHLGRLSAEAQASLSSIPVIVLGRDLTRLPFVPAVGIRTAIYGIHHKGTAYRMDELPVPLQGFIPTNDPSDADILEQLLRRVVSGERPAGQSEHNNQAGNFEV